MAWKWQNCIDYEILQFLFLVRTTQRVSVANYYFFHVLINVFRMVNHKFSTHKIQHQTLEIFLILYHGDELSIIMAIACTADFFSTRISIPTKLSNPESFKTYCRGKLDFWRVFTHIKFKIPNYYIRTIPYKNIGKFFPFQPSNYKVLAQMLNIFVKTSEVHGTLIRRFEYRVYEIRKNSVSSSCITLKASLGEDELNHN